MKGWFILAGVCLCSIAMGQETNITHSPPSVIDHVYGTLVGAVGDGAEWLDQVLDDMLTPEEMERSRTFDQFFGDRRRPDDEQKSRIKLSPFIEWGEGGEVDYGVKYSIKLDLPRVEEKIQVVVDNIDEDRDTLDAFSFSRSELENLDEEEESVSLRAMLGEFFNFDLSADAGLKFRPEPVPKLKLSAKLPWDVGWWRIRLKQSVFWLSDDGFGEKTSLSIRRNIGVDGRLRFNTAAVWSETSKGVNLGQSVSYIHQLYQDCSLGMVAGVEGHTEPHTEVDRYLLRFPFKHRLNKEWLHFVIEPGADFPEDRNFTFSPLVKFKLEFYIGH